MFSTNYSKSYPVNRTSTREVLAFCQKVMRQYKIVNPPKSIRIPGRVHCKISKIHQTSSKGSILSHHKPIFVIKLEHFVNEELKKLHSKKCSSNCIHLSCKQQILDEKLNIYRSAFDALLSKVVTFKPLLNKIKCAYDESLEVRNDKLALMEIVNQYLDEFKENINRQVEDIRENKLKELHDTVKENEKLVGITKNLKIQLSTKDTEIENLKEELEEIRSRIAFETTVNQRDKDHYGNARRQQINNGQYDTTETSSDQIEDIVLLRLCLQRTRKDLSIAHRKIIELEEMFRDVVPKRELEKLDNVHQALKRERDGLSAELKSLSRDYSSLKSTFERVKEQKNSLRDRCKTLAHTNTPRPDWSKCGQFIQGGVQRWRDITVNKSSEERLTILLSELCGAANAENDYFIGQGTDQSVPVFLRYKGKLKNRKLGRREVSILINDIWKNKSIADLDTPMGDYVLKYFTERYHLSVMRYEWIYNLYNACQRLTYDDQIGLFWGVLWGDIVENAYHEPKKEFLLMKKMMEMRMEDKKINALLAEDIMDIVDTLYPNKTNQDVENIVYAAAKQLCIDPSTQAFDITKLYASNEEGWERSEFAREFARQTMQEIKEFGKSVLNKLDIRDKNTLIEVELLKRAFVEVDEGIPQSLLSQHMKWIYKVQDLSKAKPIASNNIVQQMLTGNIKRIRCKKASKDETVI